MTTLCPDEELLAEYLAGASAPAQTADLERHFEQCTPCRELMIAEVRGDSAAPLPTSPQLLARFEDRYAIGDAIGSGNMGTVFAAEDRQLQREVALKLVGEHVDTPEAKQRLIREARMLAQLSHPNAVTIYEVGELNDQIAIAMERVVGQTLREWLASQEHDWRSVVSALLQAGRGLAAAHAEGILHRDVKPGNILVGRDGRVRLSDFGLASHQDESPSTEEGDPPMAKGSNSSRRSGTPAYMAPEQAAGNSVPASDQYSFCMTLFEALYGERPARTDAGGVQFPTSPSIPKALRDLLRRGLREDATQRFKKMSDLLGELETISAPKRHLPLLVAGALVLILGAVLIALWQKEPAAKTVRPLAHGKAEFEAVWNEELRKELETQLREGTDSPLVANAILGELTRRLDDYAAIWAEERDSASRALKHSAISAHKFQSLLHCLADKRDAFRITLEMVTARQVADRRSLSAVGGLTPPARCRLAQPHVLNEAERLELAEISTLIAGARGHLKFDQRDTFESRIEELRARLSGMPDKPHLLDSRAELEHLAGHLAKLQQDYPAAEALLREGYAVAKRGASTIVVARIAIDLMRAVGVDQSRSKEALGMRAFVEGDVAAADDPAIKAKYYGGLAAVYQAAGERDAALKADQTALTHLSQVLPADHLDIAGARYNLAISLQTTGKNQEAEAEMKAARAIVVGRMGEVYLGVATIDYGLALTVYRQGRLSEADQFIRRSLTVREQILGPEHPKLAGNLELLAAIAKENGDWQAARIHFERVHALRKDLKPTHPRYIAAVNNLAAAMTHLGEVKEAEEMLRRSLEALETEHGPDDYRLKYSLISLALIYELKKDESQNALALYRRVHDITSAKFGPEHPESAEALATIGHTLVDLGRYKEARSTLERALPLRVAALAPPHAIATSQRYLARVLVELRQDRPRARKLATEALAELSKQPVHKPHADELREWMETQGFLDE